MSEQCKLPPAGWSCSREPGHEGPCAARPKARYWIDDRGSYEAIVLSSAAQYDGKYCFASLPVDSTQGGSRDLMAIRLRQLRRYLHAFIKRKFGK